jgi:hypothetical protein
MDAGEWVVNAPGMVWRATSAIPIGALFPNPPSVCKKRDGYKWQQLDTIHTKKNLIRATQQESNEFEVRRSVASH